MTPLANALTVDVEDYFQVTAFEKAVPRGSWDGFPLRVEGNTHRILDLLDELEVKGTFFVLGWVAERLPGLVREIARRGHEIACHGYGHELVYRIGPERFGADVLRAKSLLEDISGFGVAGYRAPSYSITAESLWALDILISLGFRYDSSIFPVRHDTYGIPDAERFPHLIRRGGGEIMEFPLSTLVMGFGSRGTRFPIAGGGYLRLLPAGVIGRGMRRINSCEGRPAVLYFHPWEIDPDQPRIAAGFRSRFRHYLNLHSTERKLRQIIGGARFGTMAQVLEDEAARRGWHGGS